MKLFSLLIPVLFMVGCSSPPPPTPYPKDAKISNLTTLMNVPTKTDKVIRNSLDNGSWDITTPIYYNNYDEVASPLYNELELSYLMGNSDKIIIRGTPQLIQKTILRLQLDQLTAKLQFSKKCLQNNCRNLTLQFQKTGVTK